MKRTLAIVGFADASMELVQQSKAHAFWTMNHAYAMENFPRHPDGSLRIDRLFEMHEEAWYRRGSIPEHEHYFAWLKQDHDFDIMMHDVHPEIPCSVRYPFEEIVMLQKPLRQLTVAGVINHRPYLTNTFDYMMSLAVHEGWERIEIYGIEANSETEYSYQKPGITFQIGFAIASGIEVVIPAGSEVCNAKLYGYDAVPAVGPELLKRYHDYYNDVVPGLMDEYHEVMAIYNADPNNQDKFDAMSDVSAELNVYRGALQVADSLTGWIDDFLSRQNIEQLREFYRLNLQKCQADTNVKHGRYIGLNGNDPKEKQRLFNEYLVARANMFAQSGSVQYATKLLGECDMKEGDPILRVNIITQDRLQED